MNFEKLYDDIVIFKKRELSDNEREEILNEIIRIQSKLKEHKMGVVNESTALIVSFQDDVTMLDILNYQYQLFAIKYFNTARSAKPLDGTILTGFDII